MALDDAPAPPVPFPDSLCHRCRHLRTAGNKRGSVFLSCTHPALPKYLPQPVVRCHGFDALAAAPGAGR